VNSSRPEMLVGGTGIGYFVWNEWETNLSIVNVINANSVDRRGSACLLDLILAAPLTRLVNLPGVNE